MATFISVWHLFDFFSMRRNQPYPIHLASVVIFVFFLFACLLLLYYIHASATVLLVKYRYTSPFLSRNARSGYSMLPVLQRLGNAEVS